MEYTTRAYAKVNIGLKVTGRRDDGYHTLSSYFLLVPFFDEITLSLGDGNETIVSGNDGYLLSGEDLMAKAVRLYRERTGLKFSAFIKIKKHIPVRAGLGGGSSDASAVLRLLESHFHALGDDGLLSLSLAAGADVPFFSSTLKFAYVSGIGEKIEKREFSLPYRYITLFRADGSGTSTKEAYRKLDSISLDHSPLGEISYPLTRAAFPNDFEKIEGTEMYETLSQELRNGDYLSLSGSGSVWFLLSQKPWTGTKSEMLGTEKLFID